MMSYLFSIIPADITHSVYTLATTVMIIESFFCLFFCFCLGGTEKQHVADDYAKRLSIGRSDCEVSKRTKTY